MTKMSAPIPARPKKALTMRLGKNGKGHWNTYTQMAQAMMPMTEFATTWRKYPRIKTVARMSPTPAPSQPQSKLVTQGIEKPVIWSSPSMANNGSPTIISFLAGKAYMVVVSENQKRVAASLRKGPRSAIELQKDTGLSFVVIEKELKAMLKDHLVEREGMTDKYKLDAKITSELSRRKEIETKDPHPWRIKAFIEIQAIEPTVLEKEVAKFTENMKKDRRFTVYDLRQAPVEQKDDYYGTFIEVNFSVQDFTNLVAFCFLFGPSAIEVLKPDQITITASDLQDALVFLSDMAHKYSNAMLSLMNRQELEQFYQNVYKK